VAFDRRGYRVGYGGGFYDRFLPQVRAMQAGITYAHLIVPLVPHDDFDQRVNWLVCEEIFFQAST
jgi:5-formyltetrahydrofolate cyclo-ligase